MSSVKDLVTAYPALQEFGLLARGIQSIMIDPKVTREEKRTVLCELVEQLSDKAFNNGIVLRQVMKIINMKEEVCKEFEDTDAQVDGIIKWLPRMAKKKDILKKEVKNHRKMYSMEL